MAGPAVSAAAATGTASPHSRVPLTFNGPIAIVLLLLRYALPVAAFVVTVDALRRPSADFFRPFWRWIWALPQLLLVAVTVAGYVGGARLTAPIAGWILLLALVCFVMQIGYLLEVVFPKRPHGEPPQPPPAAAREPEPVGPRPAAPGGHAGERRADRDS